MMKKLAIFLGFCLFFSCAVHAAMKVDECREGEQSSPLQAVKSSVCGLPETMAIDEWDWEEADAAAEACSRRRAKLRELAGQGLVAIDVDLEDDDPIIDVSSSVAPESFHAIRSAVYYFHPELPAGAISLLNLWEKIPYLEELYFRKSSDSAAVVEVDLSLLPALPQNLKKIVFDDICSSSIPEAVIGLRHLEECYFKVKPCAGSDEGIKRIDQIRRLNPNAKFFLDRSE